MCGDATIVAVIAAQKTGVGYFMFASNSRVSVFGCRKTANFSAKRDLKVPYRKGAGLCLRMVTHEIEQEFPLAIGPVHERTFDTMSMLKIVIHFIILTETEST
ncbi:uncharacterized protein PHALS_06839 [Plasmopara halstedii]|uniref:Uncharacterized protein n=1 Tax=Plasmopara halstedii TaxID=4781 RepID=A0A0N7L870_PLAHL|nr:uncharacterized protein PHALS_06839 [Plasmopara halstedii]CEG49051.1 hypothetical protein PHALS_06839 [Plasmopara halstedii]|eukprot:XP_024585420.1 hypothetical protein PHALS_06839 [Plasmopara halstedii]